jgi:predicted nucleotidyltransferase
MSVSHSEKVDRILTKVTQWGSQREDISAVALVGSWASGNARIDSDIDLMFLTPNTSKFRSNEAWIDEIDRENIGSNVEDWEDEDYGLIWSRHIYLSDRTEIEFSFGLLSWASLDPLDSGTFGVVKNGFRILYDPENLLKRLLDKVSSKNQ